jgi:diguanylate cyclase (GGDEF)-like protein
LRLALLSAEAAVFDWTIADDSVVWDGAQHALEGRLTTGQDLLAWLGQLRNKFLALIDEVAPADPAFFLELEAHAEGNREWYELSGVRIAGMQGRTERVVGALRSVTEHRQKVNRLSYLANCDELTGHLNRTRLREELMRAIALAQAQSRSCAYLVAAIDKLAAINETYGFDVADEVIVATGRRLAQCLRGSDIIGRTAGNKFGIVLGECGDREMALVAERLHAGVRGEVIETRAGVVSATVSIGAVWLPESASTSQEAMLRAEEALEHAKHMGRNGFSVYAKSAQRESARRRLIAIGDEITAALDDRRIKLAYQPIVGAKSRRPEHYECLLRLERKDGGVTAAGEFIPAAETLGLVRLVDRRALEIAVSQLYAHDGIRLSINVSGTTAGDHAWLTNFINYLHEHRGVSPRMTVELTETAALQAFEENARFISRLGEVGCRVAIDDFGAGYTSFRDLRNLRVDMVKIDGAYVKNLASSPDNQLFVRTLVDLAKNFQLETVAEWVGSEEDAALLESFGVDYFQGFYFGEPSLQPVWMNKPAAAE